MVKCDDCGFCEIERSPEIDPIKLKHTVPKIISAKCNANLNKQKKIVDPFIDRKCKDYLQRTDNMSLKDYHEFKDRHITTKKNYKISTAALLISIISVITLIFSVAYPILAPPPPEIDLSFQFFKDEMVGPSDYTFRASFTLYNQGSKICFVQEASVYEILKDGSRQPLSTINDARETTIYPGETKNYAYEIFNQSEESATKQYQIIVFYEPDNYISSPIIVVDWFNYSF